MTYSIALLKDGVPVYPAVNFPVPSMLHDDHVWKEARHLLTLVGTGQDLDDEEHLAFLTDASRKFADEGNPKMVELIEQTIASSREGHETYLTAIIGERRGPLE